jgi:NAD(P)-dependent dehydrogenase (short-subunit alcohol dehydrogenase family)
LSDEERVALYRVTGTVSMWGTDRQGRVAMRKQFKKMQRQREVQEDRAVIAGTGLRQSQARGGSVEPFYHKPPPMLEAPLPSLEDVPGNLNKPKACYCCGERYSVVHHFYASMCPPCAELNFRKRVQSYDLSGRTAVVTGARVKIGFHIALKLLRAGCTVWVLTRFPHDARLRYEKELDYAQWGGRVEFYGIDLRHTLSVEKFCATLMRSVPSLDFLIHNSCQTVRRPPAFYEHLLEAERLQYGQNVVGELTQIPLLKGDLVDGNKNLIFPVGSFDVDGQQKDLREVNSWKLTLDQVSTVELAEVFLVNSIAPFVMNSRLKPLFSKRGDAHIVNVSAMEGQFYKTFKTPFHPHTNMAKAALNMMTRTSAQDYAQSGVWMNSVDTGWGEPFFCCESFFYSSLIVCRSPQ